MKFHVTGFTPMKSVYTFIFPEAFAILRAVQALVTPEFFHVTTTAKRARELLGTLISPPLDIPGKDGLLDLDELHVRVRQRVIAAYAGQVPALNTFQWQYPTAGSSEGIFHLLVQLAIKGVKTINVLDGEYEGYAAQAANLGITCQGWSRPGSSQQTKPISECRPGYWFISNPSAVDGNILPPAFLKELLDGGHKVVLDLAYVGATAPTVFDISHPGIAAVVMSFSKPYGMFRLRAGGQVYSREAVPSLYGNKWFNDSERQLLAAKLAVDIGPSGLFPKYRPVQEAIVTGLNAKYGLRLQASDNLLTAHMPVAALSRLSHTWAAKLEPFRRADGYRFCLTPYLEAAADQWLY